MRLLPLIAAFVRKQGRHVSRIIGRRTYMAAVGPAASAAVGKSWYLWPAGAAVLLGAGVHGLKDNPVTPAADGLISEPCVKTLMKREGVKVVQAAGAMLRKHGIAGRLIAQDYWFDGLESEQMVQEMICLYDKKERKFHCAVRVGREVCGYPKTVHGGLTAAIVDETFGGLYVSLWTSGLLGFITPGLTARLEIDYRKKLAADTVILCTTEVESIEGRKVWMKAHVYDGRSGVECARGRALFVAPRWSSIVTDLIRLPGRKAKPASSAP